ncbi:putative epoxide hydrolase [Mycena sanguinolenta]|uniref:Putative epoxide hydrolase n=1 Tax=Mycena sanguinolenta TaxID=230812 RepID=A0A8H6Z570_9AGAR|nr:putative epoxide hydrolase [Mycena sanguinolenta]
MFAPSLIQVASLTVGSYFIVALAAASSINNPFDVTPFTVNLSAEIPRLKSLVKNTRLPTKALYFVGADKGIELDVLRQLQTEWATTFDWETQQLEFNQLSHFTAVIEGQSVHFVHEKSGQPDAIPVILLHGWPGSFHEFLPVIKPLTQSANVGGKNVSYHVVVPSLPGFVFSSPPPLNWTVDDTARIFNTLMTEVLGYSTYAGSDVAYSLYSLFNATVRAAHLVFLPFVSPTAEEIAENNITLSVLQEVTEQRVTEFNAIGEGYLIEQSTKPNDIGLALYDSPVGQLAWLAGKIKLWSDPRAGTPPSVLNNTAILTSVSLYYLTDSFLSSVWIYAQNSLKTVYTKAPTDAPLLFTQYEYNVGLWPQEYVAKVGNLVSYTVHDFGGHFPGLDNPPALIGDIRELAQYFKA